MSGLEDFLRSVADRTPAPGGGAAAGAACALAAALTEMAARYAGLDDAVRRAAGLRAEALRLSEADLTAFAPVLEAGRLAPDDPARPARLRAARGQAAEVPLAIAEAAAETAVLARRVAREGKEGLRGDALAGADIADAAARAAARLVEINLRDVPGDVRAVRARAAVARCAG